MVYGWCLQYDKGGLAVPIVAAFWWAAGLMAAFSGLNAYCVGELLLYLDRTWERGCVLMRCRVVPG